MAAALVAGTAAATLSREFVGLRRRLFPLEAWIDSVREERAIDPQRRMIDPHHHLWDHVNQPKQKPEESGSSLDMLCHVRVSNCDKYKIRFSVEDSR